MILFTYGHNIEIKYRKQNSKLPLRSNIFEKSLEYLSSLPYSNQPYQLDKFEDRYRTDPSDFDYMQRSNGITSLENIEEYKRNSFTFPSIFSKINTGSKTTYRTTNYYPRKPYREN